MHRAKYLHINEIQKPCSDKQNLTYHYAAPLFDNIKELKIK